MDCITTEAAHHQHGGEDPPAGVPAAGTLAERVPSDQPTNPQADGPVASTSTVNTLDATTAAAVTTTPMSVTDMVIRHLAAEEAQLRTRLRIARRSCRAYREMLVVALEALHESHTRNVALTYTNRRMSTTIREFIVGRGRATGGR